MVDLEKWLPKYRQALESTFGDRIFFIGLQGSYGRGEATERSDLDMVIILDTLQPEDVRAYGAMLDTLPHRELLCGFLAGKSELLNWDAADLFQFYHDTIPLFGSLDMLLDRIDRAAAARAANLGACNICHGCIHNMLHGKQDETLRGLYKAATFVVQAAHFRRTGRYVRRLDELADQVNAQEREILCTFLRLKQGADVDFIPMSDRLLTWAQTGIDEGGCL